MSNDELTILYWLTVNSRLSYHNLGNRWNLAKSGNGLLVKVKGCLIQNSASPLNLMWMSTSFVAADMIEMTLRAANVSSVVSN